MEKNEEKEFRLFMLFKEAVEAERRAIKLYQNLINACSDHEVKKILEGFLQDEIKHERHVIEKYNEYKNKLKIQEELKE